MINFVFPWKRYLCKITGKKKQKEINGFIPVEKMTSRLQGYQRSISESGMGLPGTILKKGDKRDINRMCKKLKNWPAMDTADLLITLLGPTATGKTRLAAHLAKRVNGEIISADSRQVYKNMTIGTGKDYEDYVVKGEKIPYHLTDLVEPGTEYNVFQYKKDFSKAFKSIKSKGKLPVLCGGSGLYLVAILNRYSLPEVPKNQELRKELDQKTHEELIKILASLRTLHNTTDTTNRERTLRAIEIARYQQDHPRSQEPLPRFTPLDICPTGFTPLLFGLYFDRQKLKKRITRRLDKRLKQGMIEEVKHLLDRNISPEQLKFYGLEYKLITKYILGELNYNDMYQKLNSSIHKFAKRQMTWFRKMEKEGFQIRWIDGDLPLERKLGIILKDTGI